MEQNPDRRLPLSTMQLALLISQDGGHLHSLSVAARANNLGYNPRLQASLNFYLLDINSKLRRTVKVLKDNVRGSLKDLSYSLKDTLDSEETAGLIPRLVESDDEDLEDDGIELDESRAWNKGN